MDTLRALLISCRPGQWVKNTACLAGLVFSGRIGDPVSRLLALQTFLAFCLASSAVYLLNDLMDRKEDRESNWKRKRPIAAGELSAPPAMATAFALAAGALLLARETHAALTPLVGAYLALNLAYSRWLKHRVVLDVLSIAAGFSLRVHAGVAGIGAPTSLWMLLCMFSLALFIGFGKRRAELNEDRAGARPVLARYTAAGLDRLLTGSIGLTVAGYTLFALLGGHGTLMLLSVPPVPFVLMRYRKALSSAAYSPPEEFLLKDGPSAWGVLAWILACLLALYGPR